MKKTEKAKLSQRKNQEEIERQVAEARKAYNDERKYKAEMDVMTKVGGIFDLLAYGYKFEGLSALYVMSVVKFMIDNSRVSDDDKDHLRNAFATTLVWTGSTGVKAEDWQVVNEAIRAIEASLREPL